MAERQQLPVQFHTGFGDADLDLLLANPLLMRPLFESGRYHHVPFVLLHASYPYVRELGYLATLYGNVFADVGLAIPFVTVDIPALWSQLLGLTATSKILFSTDAYSIPEIYWLAARWGRWGLARALDGARRAAHSPRPRRWRARGRSWAATPPGCTASISDPPCVVTTGVATLAP